MEAVNIIMVKQAHPLSTEGVEMETGLSATHVIIIILSVAWDVCNLLDGFRQSSKNKQLMLRLLRLFKFGYVSRKGKSGRFIKNNCSNWLD